MISSIGFSVLLAEFYKVFDSPTLWIASLIALTVVLIPLSFLMLYLELPEIIVKVDRNYRGILALLILFQKRARGNCCR
jgi:uncharacterized BrkB/YihY/UPF0761 family membrane protein